MQSEPLNETMTADELLAVISGEDLQNYRAEKIIRSRIIEESKKYKGKPSSEWPPIEFNWDLSKEGQRFSLDGMREVEFLNSYPNGFLLGYVNLQELDKKLSNFSRRDEGKLWEVVFSDKLACLIVYLSEGRKISPPLVKPFESGEIVFNGGHHRYAIAKELNIQSIPIYVEPEYKTEIDSFLVIEWKNA